MKKKVLALVMALAMLASLVSVPAAAAGSKTFPDAVGHWAEESILRWSRSGLVKGDDLGNVNPNKPLRRCEMATILSDMLGLRTAAPISTFRDINGDEWYARAILRCAAAGIMEGSNSMSYPEDYITREEAIVMFGRALGVQPNDDPDLSEFIDGDEVSGWAAPYMATLTELGILSGMGDGTIAPHDDINRAGAFTLMDKAISVYANAPGTYTSQNANGFVVINANAYQGGDVFITGKAKGVLVAVGATNTVRFRDLKAENVIVDGKGDVVVTGKSSLDAVAVNTEVAVTVDAEATVGLLDLNAEQTTVTNAGTVKTLNCDVESTVKNSGTVNELVADAVADIVNTGTVDKLVANAAITVDNTKGTVKNAEINMGGVVMDGPPQQMTVASGVVRPANSAGRPISATGATSSGGGGSSSSGGSSRPTVSVTGVTVSPVGWVMNVGDTKTLTATVEPSNASNKSVTWKSSDKAVATVSNGKVTAVAEGTATITVTTSSGNKTAACEVTVRPEGSTDPIAVKNVAFDKSELELEEGAKDALTLIINPANATVDDGPAEWKSSDEAVVVVDTNGKLTAVAPGTAKITATITVTTTVEPPAEPDPDQPENPGEGGDPVDPADPENPGETTDPANPDEGADTQADEPTVKGETFTAECSVTVKAKEPEVIAVTGVTLNKSELELEEGKTAVLTATVAPADATDKSVTWKSSDEAVATVANGTITAVAEGTATITVTTEDGGKTATCAVTVKAKTVVDPDPVPVTGVTLPEAASVEEGKTITLTATVEPSNADNKAVTWASDDETVATVTDGTVTGVAEGSAIITVTTVDGGFTATCTVTVKAKTVVDPDPVPVTGVTLDKSELEVEEGKTAVLAATVAPADATDKTVTWKSSDEAVATVANGTVTAVAEGTATITVTTVDGEKTATCTVTVKKAAPSYTIELNQEELTLVVHDTYQLIYTVVPADAGVEVVWESDDPTVSVDENGLVTALGIGSGEEPRAVITATIKDTDIKATCVVKIAPQMTLTVSVKKGGEAVGSEFEVDTGTKVDLLTWLALSLTEGQSAAVVELTSDTSTSTGVLKRVGEGNEVLVCDFGTATVTVRITTPATEEGGEATTEDVIYTITLTKKDTTQEPSGEENPVTP